jgi:hypothetical protein
MVRAADARSRSIDISSRRIAARGKPSLIKSVLCATPETLSATSPEKLGSVRAVSENGSNSSPRRQSPARPAISSIISRAAASGAPPLRQEPLQMGEAAGITAELDLVEQLSAANAAFRPHPVAGSTAQGTVAIVGTVAGSGAGGNVTTLAAPCTGRS